MRILTPGPAALRPGGPAAASLGDPAATTGDV